MLILRLHCCLAHQIYGTTSTEHSYNNTKQYKLYYVIFTFGVTFVFVKMFFNKRTKCFNENCIHNNYTIVLSSITGRDMLQLDPYAGRTAATIL